MRRWFLRKHSESPWKLGRRERPLFSHFLVVSLVHDFSAEDGPGFLAIYGSLCFRTKRAASRSGYPSARPSENRANSLLAGIVRETGLAEAIDQRLIDETQGDENFRIPERVSKFQLR